MNIRKNNDPRTEPWGTPLETVTPEETVPSISIVDICRIKKGFHPAQEFTSNSIADRFVRSRRRGNLSNTSWKSRYTETTGWFISRCRVQPSRASSNCVSQKRLGWKLCWALDNSWDQSRCCNMLSLTMNSSTLQMIDYWRKPNGPVICRTLHAIFCGWELWSPAPIIWEWFVRQDISETNDREGNTRNQLHHVGIEDVQDLGLAS